MSKWSRALHLCAIVPAGIASYYGQSLSRKSTAPLTIYKMKRVIPLIHYNPCDW